ncbi:MAG: glycyl-radical enzyme activating protein [Cellulosilyticaceae bacterium]
MKTLVLDIQKCSIHDGPGIRTTVFLKGCPLKCAWCHNPESQSFRKQLSYLEQKCIGCGQCTKVCEAEVHHIEGDKHTVNFEQCKSCGECIRQCPQGALEQIGQSMTVEEVMASVREDIPFYRKSKGGITISGGEPLAHPEFVGQLLKACKCEGIHTCIETSGFGSVSVLEQIVVDVDLFLLDYKITGEQAHQYYTGVSFAPIRQTLDYLETMNKSVILRCPIIPNINDEKAHYEAIQEVKSRYSNIVEVEFMPYHNLGVVKAKQIGMEQLEY